MKEMWVDVKSFEGLYCVSNFGRIKSLKTQKILKQCSNGNGYLVVYLYKDSNRYTKLVHRLVAECFVNNPKPDAYIIINHRDQNKTNNIASNLEWCSYEYNSNYGDALVRMSAKKRGTVHSLEAKQKMSLSKKGKKYHPRASVFCKETGSVYPTAAYAARMLSCDKHKILDVCQGKRETYCNLHFGYC